MSESLDRLVTELEQAAARLRAEDLPREEAAGLVERCAELAQRIGSELEAEGRGASEDARQERLL